MDSNKKQLLHEQVTKIEEVLNVLKNNFDIENEMPDEYSYLDIVKNNLQDYANQKSTSKMKDIVGKQIRIISMDGEPSYTDKVGVVDRIDDQGQLHGSWGGLAINPDVDKYEVIG